jgi:hypothetical protein
VLVVMEKKECDIFCIYVKCEGNFEGVIKGEKGEKNWGFF